MIGENIKKLRNEKGMTQKDLADKLFVTPQAVSRWEQNIVEPNISTIAEMSKIFGVSTNIIMGIEDIFEDNTCTENTQNTAPMQQAIGVCEKCNKLIYDADDICRNTYNGAVHITCKECDEKARIAKEERISKIVSKRRIRSYIVGGIVAAIFLAFSIFLMATTEQDALSVAIELLIPVMMFTFTSCLCLKNNFVYDMMDWCFTRGFINMPGVIFNLSLDGIIWLLTVKLFLWVLNLLISILLIVGAFFIAQFISLVDYGIALNKSFKRPEDSSDLI